MTVVDNPIQRFLPRSAATARMRAHRVIRVHGADATALLQGQFSNDIHALEQAPAQFSSWSSPKGRVLAFLRALKQGDQYWLVVDEAIHDAFLQRLKMFVLRSKVQIETAPELSGMVISGPQTHDLLTQAGVPAPDPGNALAHEGAVFLGVPGPAPRVEIYGATDRLPALGDDAGDRELARWDVLFHLPRINEANREQHVAQHLDLDTLGAISFKKGCYTGQEIIARMKYLGKVKKRARVFSATKGKAGDTIRTADDRSAGEVVNAATFDGGVLILASVNLDALDTPLAIDGAPLTLVD